MLYYYLIVATSSSLSLYYSNYVVSSSSNTPIPFLTDRIIIGEPLPDTTYTTDEELA